MPGWPQGRLTAGYLPLARRSRLTAMAEVSTDDLLLRPASIDREPVGGRRIRCGGQLHLSKRPDTRANSGTRPRPLLYSARRGQLCIGYLSLSRKPCRTAALAIWCPRSSQISWLPAHRREAAVVLEGNGSRKDGMARRIEVHPTSGPAAHHRIGDRGPAGEFFRIGEIDERHDVTSFPAWIRAPGSSLRRASRSSLDEEFVATPSAD